MGSTPALMSENVVDLFTLCQKDLTCTGLAYDEKDDGFWVNSLGYATPDQEDDYSPAIVEFSADWKQVLKEIDLRAVFPDESITQQGVAYDSLSDSLWLVKGDEIVNLTKNGEILSTISTGEYSGYKANGICFDSSTDSLWVLFFHDYLVQYEKENGTIVRAIKCDFQDQDQLFFYEKENEIWLTVGADYNGEDNYIYAVDIEAGTIQKKFKLLDSYAVEGLAVVNGKLYVANDGKYHAAKKAVNYIAVYTLPNQ